jgi:hypothetical protein
VGILTIEDGLLGRRFDARRFVGVILFGGFGN